MKFKAKHINIGTGGILIGVLTFKDATRLDVYPADRLVIKHGHKRAIVTLDIVGGETHKKTKHKHPHFIKEGEIGFFEEVQKALGTKNNEFVEISIEERPKSIEYIKKKLKGKALSEEEMFSIVKDINDGKLMDIEITYFVAACYMKGMDFEEIAALTNAMVKSGQQLRLRKKIIVDKHCIGGVAGNRTTMLTVPILAAGGLTVPKTSSRSITSAAGTSDTVEMLCSVEFSIKQMKHIVEKTGGCLVWGGAVNLAPVDDKIIQVEHPLSLDPNGQLLASILAKKKSVSATHISIDIPVGKGAKIESMKKAKDLKGKFEKLGEYLGMKTIVIITDGNFPIGRGVGPALEARDVIEVYHGSGLCNDLKEKSIMLAGKMFELTGKAEKGKGKQLARYLLESGKAEKKFWEIIEAQGGKKIKAEDIRVAREKCNILAKKTGRVCHIDNRSINKIARIAGAPEDKEAGVYLHKQRNEYVKKGEPLFTIYSDNKERLKYAKEIAQAAKVYEVKE